MPRLVIESRLESWRHIEAESPPPYTWPGAVALFIEDGLAMNREHIALTAEEAIRLAQWILENVS